MAKLYFYQGTMSSSKTMNLLMAAHNYEEQGKRVLVFTSGIDNRSGIGRVSSRVGVEREAIPVTRYMDLFEEIQADEEINGDLYCVLLDEVQFFQEEQIHQLAEVVDVLGIPVLAYGLKTDFTGALFEGSKALLEQADKISEIKTICTFCNKKATHNLRTNDGYPVYEGEQIQIGDEEYHPVCREHHKRPRLQPTGQIVKEESKVKVATGNE